MLSFAVSGKVSEICNEELRVINDYEYQVIRLIVGKSLSIYAYLDATKEVKVGEHIKSDNVYLTNHEDERSPKDLALRFGCFEVVSKEEYVPMEHLEVRCNGKFIKPANSVIRPVGAMKKPFLPGTLSIKNEFGSVFNILMVGTYKQAEKLNQIKSNTYVNVKARMFPKLREAGFELNVVDIEVVAKSKE